MDLSGDRANRYAHPFRLGQTGGDPERLAGAGMCTAFLDTGRRFPGGGTDDVPVPSQNFQTGILHPFHSGPAGSVQYPHLCHVPGLDHAGNIKQSGLKKKKTAVHFPAIQINIFLGV